MTSSIDPAALWALAGGTVYAGSRLSTALWSGAEVSLRDKRLALSQFAVSMLLAPVAGAAFTPLILESFPTKQVAPVALTVGLFVNAVWPILTERNFLRTLLRDIARGVADRLGSQDTR